MLKEAFFAFSASREPKMDRVRPAMLIAALVVDVGRRLPRRCGSAVPRSGWSRWSGVINRHQPYLNTLNTFGTLSRTVICDTYNSADSLTITRHV